MRRTNGFGERTTTSKTDKRVFIAFEGYKAEVDYFNEISRIRDQLGIDSTIRLVILNRSRDEIGISDPKRVATMLKDHVRWMREGKASSHLYSELVVSTFKLDRNTKAKVRRAIEGRIEGSVEGWEHGITADDPRVIECTKEVLVDIGLSSDYSLGERSEFYESDTICFVVDRDKSSSRPESYYRSLIERCDSDGIDLYVTNPKFELWALMSFEGTRDAIASVAKCPDPASAVDSELDRVWRTKGLRRYAELAGRLDVAMANSSGYVFDIHELESKVGTNIPMLIESLRGAKHERRGRCGVSPGDRGPRRSLADMQDAGCGAHRRCWIPMRSSASSPWALGQGGTREPSRIGPSRPLERVPPAPTMTVGLRFRL